VEHAGILSRRDDWLIRHLRPPAGELGDEFRLEFVFLDAGFQGGERSLEAGRRDRDRLLHESHFGRAFHGAEPPQERRGRS